VIEARADLADGPAGMIQVGLPDTARYRIRAAIAQLPCQVNVLKF